MGDRALERGIQTRLGFLLVLACVVVLSAPGAASAWKWTFQDFLEEKGQAFSSSLITARKCHGGKLGPYKFRAINYTTSGNVQLTFEVTAELPVTPKFKSIKDVDVGFQASEQFHPGILAAIAEAYGAFFDQTNVRWDPGDLTFKHPALIVFGSEILSEGVHKEDFKPKDKC